MGLTRFCWISGLVILLSGCSPEESVPGLQEVYWGEAYAGEGIVNRVAHISTWNEQVRAYSYWTGASSSGVRALDDYPRMLVGELHEDSIHIRVFGYDQRVIPSSEFMDGVVKAVVSARNIWLIAFSAVQVELYLVPEDVSFQFARKVEWHEGEPFTVSLFFHEAKIEQQGRQVAETVVHELYHVLTNRWGVGISHAPESHLVKMAEETTAELYSACSILQAEGSLAFMPAAPALTVNNEVTYVGKLEPDQINNLLTHYQDEPILGFAGPIFAQTAFDHLFSGNNVISANSAAGFSMFALCRQVVSEPVLILDWFQELAR